jgi:hypothetical protein
MFKSLQGWGKFGAIVGIICGAIGALAAIAAVLVAGLVAGQSVVTVIVETTVVVLFSLVFFGILFFVFRWAFKSVGTQRDLAERMEKGEPIEAAEAAVIEVHETGVTLNEVYPMIGMTLEVRRKGIAPYRVQVKWLIDRFQIPQFQPGAVIPVLVDPKDPNNVAMGGPGPGTAEGQKKVGWGVTPGQPATDGAQTPEQQAERMLRENEARLAPVSASGQPAEATILASTPLNIFVNGNNPAMKFTLEVHPQAGPKFQAETTGVIAEASIPRYQPGSNIQVKYDPKDLTMVTIDHS